MNSFSEQEIADLAKFDLGDQTNYREIFIAAFKAALMYSAKNCITAAGQQFTVQIFNIDSLKKTIYMYDYNKQPFGNNYIRLDGGLPPLNFYNFIKFNDFSTKNLITKLLKDFASATNNIVAVPNFSGPTFRNNHYPAGHFYNNADTYHISGMHIANFYTTILPVHQGQRELLLNFLYYGTYYEVAKELYQYLNDALKISNLDNNYAFLNLNNDVFHEDKIHYVFSGEYKNSFRTFFDKISATITNDDIKLRQPLFTKQLSVKSTEVAKPEVAEKKVDNVNLKTEVFIPFPDKKQVPEKQTMFARLNNLFNTFVLNVLKIIA